MINRKKVILQMSDIVNNCPDFFLMPIRSNKIVIDSVKEERKSFKKDQCSHQSVDSVHIFGSENCCVSQDRGLSNKKSRKTLYFFKKLTPIYTKY